MQSLGQCISVLGPAASKTRPQAVPWHHGRCLVRNNGALASQKFWCSDVVAATEAGKYRGVSYHKRDRFYTAQACVKGNNVHIGCFKDARRAAKAYDQFLRARFPDDPVRLKKCLNHPSQAEASFTESALEARMRALEQHGNNYRKEAAAFQMLIDAFNKSSLSSLYEFKRLTGASRADAIFMVLGGECGIRIQLKAASGSGKNGGKHMFGKVSGYDGMLVVLAALNAKRIWAAPGKELTRGNLCVTVGSASDSRWSVPDLGSYCVECFNDEINFPRVSIQEARLECAPNGRTEEVAHQQLGLLLRHANLRLTDPHVHMTTVDSLLHIVGARGEVAELRLQEKASHLMQSGQRRFRVNLRKSGGSLGSSPYDEEDFDLLVACVMQAEQLQGVFLIPMSVLIQHGFAGRSGTQQHMGLYPPWAPPRRRPAILKYAWQHDFFLDLRAWESWAEPSPEQQKRLWDLISLALTVLPSERRCSVSSSGAEREANGEKCIESCQQAGL